MTRVILTIFVCASLAGCANSSIWDMLANNDSDIESQNNQHRAPQMHIVNVMGSDSAGYAENTNMGPKEGSSLYGSASSNTQHDNSNGSYTGRLQSKHLGDYVQSMAQDLVTNMEYLTDKTPIGITNFALIDSDLQKTNLLGYQLAESFIHEMHKFRIPIIDFKATEYIRVTDHGDFFLTRDFLELTERAPIEYILTGTLTKHQGGYLVNARILGLRSKAVVASAQMLMPFYVVDALLPSENNMVDGVKLTQGD